MVSPWSPAFFHPACRLQQELHLRLPRHHREDLLRGIQRRQRQRVVQHLARENSTGKRGGTGGKPGENVVQLLKDGEKWEKNGRKLIKHESWETGWDGFPVVFIFRLKIYPKLNSSSCSLPRRRGRASNSRLRAPVRAVFSTGMNLKEEKKTSKSISKKHIDDPYDLLIFSHLWQKAQLNRLVNLVLENMGGSL